MTDFPTSPDTMTPEWLGAALGAPAGRLRGWTCEAVGTGQMCDSFRLWLNWDAKAGEEPPGLPASVIAKCPSHDAASRHVAALTGTYVKEVAWYRELAGRASVSAPRCFHADIDNNDVDFILILEDLAPARQGDQLAGMDPAALGPCIYEAAKLHAMLWNSPELDGFSWLKRDNADIVRALFPQLYSGFRERYAARLAADVLDLGAEIVMHLDRWLARTPAARTIIHGDLRIDNILFANGSARCWLVDWQTLGIGSGASDLAYLVGTSIADPAARDDAAAFALWLDALQAEGIEVEPAALWADYRIGALSGYFMAVFASMSVERTARGDEMFAVMAERPARQAIALGSIDALAEGNFGQ